MQYKSAADMDVRGKRVLVREDLNVPLKDGAIADYTRVDAAVPTLRDLRDRGARVIVISHLGRPAGPDPQLSLHPVAAALSERLGSPVAFCEATVGPVAQAAAGALRDGDVLLLENLRFDPGEEADDPAFAQSLAALADLYVNDAFGTAHRAHASTVGVAKLLPNAAGTLMRSELDALTHLTKDPVKPFVCVIGGAKVKDKVGVLSHLLERVDAFCIGGGMANTFLAAQGINVGSSLRDADLAPAAGIIARAAERNVTLHLPVDAVVSTSLEDMGAARVATIADVGADMILDIGPDTAAAYGAAIEKARTIVFNGPMGVYEIPAYQMGTLVVGEAIARATAAGAVSVVGGGDAAAAAHQLGFADRMTHVSTGGGATLEFLEGRVLPGVGALNPRA